jgi:Ala-tRNA(Pro) deacylase
MATKRITEFLDGSRTRYVLLIHSPAFSAQEVAESVHLPGRFIAKTVIIKIDGRLAMAVVPATMDVDLLSLKEQLGARRVELADELEFADRFRGCQLGTAPPFGRLFGIDTYVDEELACEESIVFNAGTHSHAISMGFHEYQRLAQPKTCHIARKPIERSRFAQI